MTGSWATGGRSSSDTRAAERWRLGDGPKPARVPRQRRPVIHQRGGDLSISRAGPSQQLNAVNPCRD